jgi:hydroxycarboxylate dehydrogenase B
MPVFRPQGLLALSHLIASRMGSAEAEAREVADHLVRANLSGHDSHGVGMLPTYVRLLQDGLLVPNQTAQTVLDSRPLLVIDARRGFGQRMAADAVRQAIARAQQSGACVLALRNASHIGRIGTYAELASAEGCAFTAFVKVADHPPTQAPWGSADGLLGTNPFCAAVPEPDGPAVMLDMATTTIAAGKARVAANKGLPVPEGTLIDASGAPTTDPTGFIRDHSGALVSFGKHKGSGLAIMCEIMASAIAGGRGGDQDNKGGVLSSMLATVIDLRHISDPVEIGQRIDAARSHIKGARLAPGFDEILLPGEPERRLAADRNAHGIEVDPTTWTDIQATAQQLGITSAEIAQTVGAN